MRIEETSVDWYDYGRRFYDPAGVRFTTIDPMAESYPHQSPFVYADNNPVRFIDFMGMNASTHTDENGNVIAVFHDGDLGVYKHEDAKTKEEVIAKIEETGSSSGGGELMGSTLEWNSFLLDGDPNKGEVGKIDFKSNEAVRMIAQYSYIVSSMDKGGEYGNLYQLLQYMLQGSNGEFFDLKSKGGSVGNIDYYYRGSQLTEGVYVSARDAGNILAGITARMAGIKEANAYAGFGALQLSGNNFSILNMARNYPKAKGIGISGFYGEKQISHIFQKRGYNLNFK